MYHRILSILLFSCLLLTSSAQDTKSSYYKALGNLMQMNIKLGQGNYDQFSSYGKKATVIFEEIGFYELSLKTSNSLARVYLQTNKVDSAKQITTRNLRILDSIEQGGGAKAGTYFISGATYLTIGQADSALFYLQKAQVIYDTLSNYMVDTAFLPDSLAFVKESYYESLNKDAVSNNRDLVLARVHNYLGLAYLATLEFDRARITLEKALYYYKKTNNYPELFSALINIGQAILGNANAQEERFDSAMVYFNQALKLAEAAGGQAIVFKGVVKRFIALMALRFHRKELAVQHYQEADSILSNAEKDVLAKLVQVPSEGLELSLKIERAWVYASINNLGKAKEILTDVQVYFEEFKQTGTNQTGEFMAETSIILAQTYALLDNWKEAHRFSQLALSALNINYGDEYLKPDIEAERFHPQPQLLDVKIISSVAALFEKQAKSSQDIITLESAYQYYRLAEKHIDQSRFYYLGVTGQTFFNENALFNADYLVRNIENALIRIGYQLPSISSEDVLQHIEKGKAFILRNAIEKVTQFRTIPDSLIQLDRSFRERLGQLNSALIREKINANRQTTLNEQWLDTQNEYEEFTRQFSAQYPDFHTLKWGGYIPSIEEARQLLTNNQSVIIEYHFGDENELYIFWIQKDTSGIEKVTLPDDFSQIFDHYTSIVKSAADAEKSTNINSYLSSGHLLYQLLLHPVLNQLPKINHLIIVPDQRLHTMEFDYLLTKPSDLNEAEIIKFSETPRYNQLPFLIKSFSSQYVNSIATLISQKELHYQAEPETEWLNYGIFQPSFKNFSWSMELSDFPATGQDTALYRLLEADQFLSVAPEPKSGWLGPDATEFNFRTVTSKYKFNILHIYSHGLLHPNAPLTSSILLAKSPSQSRRDRIRIDNLYNQPVYANLVIVNSCDSGNSKLLAGGEGLISMGRGFFYAGSPSLILGRWSIQMGSTYTITISFMEKLKVGKSIAKALQEAKTDHLQSSNVGAFQKAPYYWAALSHWGKNQFLSF